MILNFLGTGTSVGVPFLGCDCAVCKSDNPKNKRYRSSVFIDFDRSTSPPRGLLVDTATELRLQMIRLGFRQVEGVFYTHEDADHVSGIDDLRPFNFNQNNPIPIFGDLKTLSSIKTRFAYAFGSESTLENGSPPRLEPKEIFPGQSFDVAGEMITPISIHHGRQEILGLRIKNLAYLTDCSSIPDCSRDYLSDLDTLIISGLRQTPHPNHLTVDQAVEEILKVKPKRAFITHISHSLEHKQMNMELAKIASCQIQLAYDGLAIEF